MFEIGLAILLVSLTGGIAFALRRRPSRRPALAARVGPLPAGMRHLASTVSDLSDLQIHRPAAARAHASRRRLGVLLGLR